MIEMTIRASRDLHRRPRYDVRVEPGGREYRVENLFPGSAQLTALTGGAIGGAAVGMAIHLVRTALHPFEGGGVAAVLGVLAGIFFVAALWPSQILELRKAGGPLLTMRRLKRPLERFEEREVVSGSERVARVRRGTFPRSCGARWRVVGRDGQGEPIVEVERASAIRAVLWMAGAEAGEITGGGEETPSFPGQSMHAEFRVRATEAAAEALGEPLLVLLAAAVADAGLG